MTTVMVNEYRKKQGGRKVSQFTVMATFYQLQPKVDVLFRVQSGGHNEKWIDVRLNVIKQLQIMLGWSTIDEVITDNKYK